MSQHKVESKGSKATIDTNGGRLSSLEIFGQEVMITEGPKPTRWGSFPMIPWCGRLAFGKLFYAGNNYDMPLTSPPHANHGFTHIKEWDLVSADAGLVELSTELDSPWPFGGAVTQSFKISENTMSVKAEVTAADQAMPVMIGWHPWFRKVLSNGSQAVLDVKPSAMYAVTSEQIPTGELVPVSEPPWDECFVGLENDPVISYPGSFDLKIESNFDHWVVFTEPEHGLCVEPQSGQPNQSNTDPRVLEPGETFSGSMTFIWEKN